MEIIPRVNEHGYVVVETRKNEVSGIVTSSDLGTAFADIAGPYLLLEQIETTLRLILKSLIERDAISQSTIHATLPEGDKPLGREVEDYIIGELV